MRNKRKKHLKQLRLQISRMKRAMKRNSKKYKLRRRHHLENRKRGITARRIWESKDYINKEVPKNFSFIDNTDEVLKYFVECKSLLHKKEKVQCDLSHITSSLYVIDRTVPFLSYAIKTYIPQSTSKLHLYYL